MQIAVFSIHLRMFIKHGSHSFDSNDRDPLLFLPASVFVVVVFEGLPSPEPELDPISMNGRESINDFAQPARADVK